MNSSRSTANMSKHHFLLVFCFLLVFIPQIAVAASNPLHELGNNSGANSHPHNLSSLNTDAGGIHAPLGTEDRICIFCHTPHSASAEGPLWNRTAPTGPLVGGSFPTYGEISGRDVDIVIDDVGVVSFSQYGVGTYPNGASRLCLSCHDGVTAIGEVISPGTGSLPLGNLGELPTGSTSIIDLDTSHPISFVYNSDVHTAIEAVKGVGTYNYPPTSGLDILDKEGRMQCTACHDPHTNTGVSYGLPMWRNYTGPLNEAADYDGTCNECHNGVPGPSIHPIP